MESSSSVRSLTVCLLLAACGQEPDLAATPTDELIRIVAWAQPGEPSDSLGNRAAHELSSRPPQAVIAELTTALAHHDVGIRRWAAGSVGWQLALARRSHVEDAARDRVEATLLELLQDRDEAVRANALYSLAHSRAQGRLERPPAVVEESIRSLVVSDVATSRAPAAFAAMQFGPTVSALAPLLVARAKAEPDSGVRFLLAAALPRIAAGDAAAADCLLALLDDPDAEVRSAATAIGEFRNAPPAAVKRLLRCAVDDAEASDVRKAAATSAAKIVASPEDAEPLLRALLDCRAMFAIEPEQFRWLDAVGRVSAAASAGDTRQRARAVLELEAKGAVESAALVARSGLARAAFADRDEVLGRSVVAELRNAVPGILAAIPEAEGGWLMVNTWAEPVLESLVELSRWPAVGVEGKELRPVFEALSRDQPHWVRDWAAKQAARLP